MPLVTKNCEQQGNVQRAAYTDKEVGWLLSDNLVLLCKHCEEHHLVPGVTHQGLLESIYEHVAQDRHRTGE